MVRRAFQDSFSFDLRDDGRYRAPVKWADFPDLSLDIGSSITFNYSDYVSNADLLYVDSAIGDGTLTYTPPSDAEDVKTFVLSGINTQTGASASAVLEIQVLASLVSPSERVAFEWSGGEDFFVYRGGESHEQTISWEQGVPRIADFSVDDIQVLFYTNGDGDAEISKADPLFFIGDQSLSDLVTLHNFTDNGDGMGSVDVSVDPSGIEASELSMPRDIHFALRVSQ